MSETQRNCATCAFPVTSACRGCNEPARVKWAPRTAGTTGCADAATAAQEPAGVTVYAGMSFGPIEDVREPAGGEGGPGLLEAVATARAMAQQMPSLLPPKRRHSHYFKDVSRLQTVDVYRVLQLFGVTDPCIQHAAKKLLVAGDRGVKDQGRDVQEAIDTLTRWQEMRAEDGATQGGN